ncbi:hypothetical protein E2C01_085188 [Portunus trituberculatus]|uniref:Uncharacterized protein n=1 Tax=Portunus trituberculatus TaxID=210409 RepID=A0A5B7JCW9_PORTR|nr:hypothetical protein [Portunus trituberculatus]
MKEDEGTETTSCSTQQPLELHPVFLVVGEQGLHIKRFAHLPYCTRDSNPSFLGLHKSKKG